MCLYSSKPRANTDDMADRFLPMSPLSRHVLGMTRGNFHPLALLNPNILQASPPMPWIGGQAHTRAALGKGEAAE